MNPFFLTLLCLFTLNIQSHALVLEDLIESETLESTVQNKKIGLYVGSFDPFHKGHEALANDCMEKGPCDMVILFPAWGGDSYKKRADINLRHDMIFALFKDHPTIMVTRLTPVSFQRALTVVTDQISVKGGKNVVSKFKGTQFIGILGSDIAIVLNNSKSALTGFMAGIQIPKKYAKHTLGGLMALPVNSFIVKLRDNDNLSELQGSIGDRKIVAVLKDKDHFSSSSTAVKKLLHNGKPISHLVRKPIIEIITKYKLYGL